MDEPTAPVAQPKLNEEQSEEGSYNRTVYQAKQRRVRKNNPDKEIERNGCKYKDFMDSKPPSLYGSPTPVEFMEKISKMEMVFESCDYNDQHNTILVVRKLKTGVLRWWKLLADCMPNGEERKMS